MRKVAAIFLAVFVFSTFCAFASSEKESVAHFGKDVLDNMAQTVFSLIGNKRTTEVSQLQTPRIEESQSIQNTQQIQPLQETIPQQVPEEAQKQTLSETPMLQSMETTDASKIDKAADEVLATLSKLRELPINSAVNKEIASKEQVTTYIIKKMQESVPDEKIKGEEYLLKKLKLIPQDLVYKDFIIRLYTEQVIGYYDYDVKKFYVVEEIPLSILIPVMAHELTHALQDQNFGLKDFTKPMLDNSDASSARASIVEGDATYAMLDFTLNSLGVRLKDSLNNAPAMEYKDNTQIEMPEFNQAPEFIRKSLLMPYTEGFNFIIYTVKNYDISSLNNLYSNIPESSEQILHPEKFFVDKDSPAEAETLDLKEALGPDWQEVNSDVFGEFSIYMFLKIFSDEIQAKEASEGWDGDRIKVFQNGSDTAFVWNTLWDSEKDAQEFFSAYVNTLDRRYSNITVSSAPEQTNFYEAQTEEGSVYITFNGSEVLIVEGFAQSVMEKIKSVVGK